MRVCLVSREVAGLRGGGIGTYVVEAGHALRAAGHEVWLITARPARGEAALREPHEAFDRIAFVEDAPAADRGAPFGRARRVMQPAHGAFAILKAAGVPFDYVEFADYEGWGYTTLLEQRLFRTLGDAVGAAVLHSPTVEIRTYNGELHSTSPAVREQSALEDEAIRRAPVVWSPSTRLAGIVAERLGLPEDFAEVIRYPMRLPANPPEPPRAGRRLEDLSFLYFGRIEPRKGVRALVEAFTRMPELRLELVGGDLATSPFGESEVEYLRRRAGPNITFSPPVPRAEMLRRVAATDVVVLPSIWENWPNTCIESLAAARVVIGGRDGGMGEMIEPGVSGFTVEGGSADDLVRVVREELGGALDRLDAVGAAGARRIRELSEPETYVAAIERLVATRRPAPLVEVREPPLVSVVTPYHNEDLATVGAALDSAIAQDHTNLELVIVDDGSTRDDAGEILDALARRDDRVRVLRKPNGGLGSARNHAIDHARGDAILCLDADNLLRPDYARVGMEVFAREPAVMAIAPQLLSFEDGTDRPLSIVQGVPYSRPLAILRNSMGDAGAMFRAAVFREQGLRYDELVHGYEDWALWLDMATAGLEVLYLPRVLFDYRVRAGSLTDAHAWDHHLHLLSLLVERHLPPGDHDAQKDLVTALVHGWGIGALLAGLGRHEDFWERPTRFARRVHENQIRYSLADLIAGTLDRIPGLKRVIRPWLRAAYDAHGRFKDRRR